MHPLHDYVAKQLADKLKDRRVVVWYDERGEFRPFVDEVRGGPRAAAEPIAVGVAGIKASLAEYAGSLFELRAVVEPLVSGDKPEALVVYIPGLAHDAKASVLMELEKAGRTWKPELKQLAKNVLLQKYTLGVVDEMLPFDRKVSYEDLARAAAGHSGAEPPSILKAIFRDVRGNDGLIAVWLVDESRDAEIHDKEATRELTKLVKAWLGLDLDDVAALGKLRAIVLRYLFAGEFRLDLSGEAPATLAGVPMPETASHQSALRLVLETMRSDFKGDYPAIADRLEEEFRLAEIQFPAESLGAIDTFRFEERALLKHVGTLIAGGHSEQADSIIAQRQGSFWLGVDVGRKAQWEAMRRMAELSVIARRCRREVRRQEGDVTEWVEAYCGDASRWHEMDRAHRQLEAWVAGLDTDPDELALAAARRAYEGCLLEMAEGFSKALVSSRWSYGMALHQTRICREVVGPKPKPVAYLLVDAMRFEMAAELAGRLPHTAELTLKSAIGALPTITPIGMAALSDPAASSFSAVEQEGKFGARVDGAFVSDLPARKKLWARTMPQSKDFELDDVLAWPSAKLARAIEGTQVLVVRSQDIDGAGEAGFTRRARRIMDEAIGDVALAIKKLAGCGIQHFVVTADHGHLFASQDRDESMRIDPPGGDTVALHRRCWVGRGGSTPRGCIRVTGANLGYDTDLDFVFPAGLGVFKAGGDLAYHHGGISLQELIVPVLSVRLAPDTETGPQSGRLEVIGAPAALNTRIFSVTVRLTMKSPLLAQGDVTRIRPLLVSSGKQVGSVGMVIGAELDKASGTTSVEPGRDITVAFLLTDDDADVVRIVVQDPATDAEIYRSPADIPVKLGV